MNINEFPLLHKMQKSIKKSNWFNTTWFQSMLMAPDQKFHSPIRVGKEMVLSTY